VRVLLAGALSHDVDHRHGATGRRQQCENERPDRAAAKALLAEFCHYLPAFRVWTPNIGPQHQAYTCEADELFFGGSAGSSKTDLGLGLALTAHRRSLILRRVNKDAGKLVERMAQILGHRDRYNGQLQRWRLGEGENARLIEFSGCEFEDDKQRFKGDPHDLIYFDEGSDFLYSQYRFIIGWNRSVVPGQRCRVVVGSNPPTAPEGLWVIRHWAPWLDQMHPKPAQPCELRWFTTAPDGSDVEVDGPGPHFIGGEKVTARSRTFIPGRLWDNPDLDSTGYGAVLSSLPEELRRAYRDGDFSAGLKDDAFQVIPTAWIEAAQKRWTERPPREHMTAIGLDVAQGGEANTVAAPRYGGWYDRPTRKPGRECRLGTEVAAMVVQVRRNSCPVVVDCGGGWGAEAYGALRENGIPAVAYLGNKQSTATSREGNLKFYNRRAEDWWRFREELNPDQEFGSAIALPPDATIKADLAAPRFQMTSRGIKLEEKAEIMKRLGRSIDDGDAIVMAMNEGGKAAVRQMRSDRRGNRPERANIGHAELKQRFRQ
jgi:hypothetical protein